MTDAALVARYPFLPGASSVLGDLQPSLRELVEDPSFEQVRALAREEVLLALSSAREAPGEGVAGFDAARPEERVLAFLYARMLVAVAPSSQRVARRWSEGLSRRAGVEIARREAPSEELLALGGALDLELAQDPKFRGSFGFALPSYVRLSSSLRDERFRLSRQRLHQGTVDVEHREVVELLQEGVRSYLLDEMAMLRLEPELQTTLKARESEILTRISTLSPALGPGGFGVAMRPDLFPPCMREMRATMDRGANVSHAGRFALASFMHKVGADLDAIVEAYHGSPNFKESITRYQVTQIAHHDGGEGYTPPDCATMAANGLCVKELDDAMPPLCADPGKLRNPLNYYRIRVLPLARKNVGEKSGEAPAATATPEGAPAPPSAPTATSSGPASTPSPAPPERTTPAPRPAA
ncbi:MAG: hypothetical protein KGJ23_05665 [Euryarchaeota archaeon]|nr:hypothetical protein [Euryarchaeota archaeon]